MFETPLNQKTVTCKLKRIEVCDLLIACTAISSAAKKDGETGHKWDNLHDKLKQILDSFDEKQGF
jgi:hypothetical protein